MNNGDIIAIHFNNNYVNPDASIMATGTLYSDRLYQWDHKRFDSLCIKHFGDIGQYWDKRSPELIEAFLKDYVDDNRLILVSITQHENYTNGYPYWQFDYNIEDKMPSLYPNITNSNQLELGKHYYCRTKAGLPGKNGNVHKVGSWKIRHVYKCKVSGQLHIDSFDGINNPKSNDVLNILEIRGPIAKIHLKLIKLRPKGN